MTGSGGVGPDALPPGPMTETEFRSLYERLRGNGAELSMRKVRDRSEIFPVFHDLFQRRANQEKAS